MRDAKGRWIKGTSGNQGGRPKKGQSVIDALILELDKKHDKKRTKKEALAAVLVAAGIAGDTGTAYKVYQVIQRSIDSDQNDRLDEIEQRLDEAESEKNKDD